jgi:sulfotransferase 6B1
MNAKQSPNLRSLLIFQARLLRRSYRRLRQSLRYGSLSASPVLFANSFPKSGTHLLTQVMHGFTRLGAAVDSGLPAVVTFDGFTGRQLAEAEILAGLRRFKPGDIGYGHVHALPEAVRLLSQDGFASFFILRDPRDVVVSHVHYVAEMAPKHIHYRYYHEVLQSFDERLSASIAGVPVEELAKAGAEFHPGGGRPIYEPLPDIRSRFMPYLGWLGQPRILVLRYEDLMNDRQAALKSILGHAVQRGFKPACSESEALAVLENSIDPQRSPTFRSGKTGGWCSAFTPQHQALFDQVAGNLLQELGYGA